VTIPLFFRARAISLWAISILLQQEQNKNNTPARRRRGFEETGGTTPPTVVATFPSFIFPRAPFSIIPRYRPL
jgi:hypothetical protein